MISLYQNKQSRKLLSSVVTLLLLAAVMLQPIQASTDDAKDGTKAAVAAMEGWLKGIDAGGYAQSWKDASVRFQKAVSEAQWQAALDQVRKPLGSCSERKLVSASRLSELPAPASMTIKGDFVVAQFEASFDNLIGAVETVTFEKEADGNWKASGYFIKPKSS